MCIRESIVTKFFKVLKRISNKVTAAGSRVSNGVRGVYDCKCRNRACLKTPRAAQGSRIDDSRN